MLDELVRQLGLEGSYAGTYAITPTVLVRRASPNSFGR